VNDPLGGDRRVVLVVEDHNDLRELCRVNLDLAGFEVLEAADAASALELAIRWHPASIVLDLTLPDLDGWDLLDRIRRDAELSDTPVVVVSARSAGFEEPRAVQAGVSAFLPKPYDPSRLVAAVGAAMSATGTDGRPEGESL